MDRNFSVTVNFDAALLVSRATPTPTPSVDPNAGISGTITPGVKLEQPCLISLAPIPQGRGDFVLNLQTEDCAASLRPDELLQDDYPITLNGSWSYILLAKGISGKVCKIHLNLKSAVQSVSVDNASIQM